MKRKKKNQSCDDVTFVHAYNNLEQLGIMWQVLSLGGKYPSVAATALKSSFIVDKGGVREVTDDDIEQASKLPRPAGMTDYEISQILAELKANFF